MAWSILLISLCFDSFQVFKFVFLYFLNKEKLHTDLKIRFRQHRETDLDVTQSDERKAMQAKHTPKNKSM